MKIIVIGAVAGGATALARLRRLNETAEIVVFERGSYVSYANCGLPYYIGRTIQERDALFVSTKESIEQKYKVDIRLRTEVLRINREAHSLDVKDLETGRSYQESYDKLLLSTGSSPFVPNRDYLRLPRVFQLWTIPDVDAIDAFIREEKPRRAVIVGGGFIGLEMAENLVQRGLDVTLCDMADQVMPPMDKDMAKLVEIQLAEQGVQLFLGDGLKNIEEDGRKLSLASGKVLETDLVILSIGVRPNSQLAAEAGLDLNARRGVKVDEFLRTSDPDIYAVGDVIGVRNYVSGDETMIPLAGPANKQGRSVADNLLGLSPKPYRGTMGTAIAKIFDLSVASVGESEKSLQRAGKKLHQDYHISLIHPMSHAGYYPGAVPMTLKLIFAADGKILGAQIVGYDGVDKRIDTLAASIHFGGKVSDLTELELAYAPPYSSAKDPVNFAGYTAENILAGLVKVLTWEEWTRDKSAYTLLDVREDVEVHSGMVEGARHLSLSSLREHLDELDKDRPYLIYCAVGLRGYIAARILEQNGFKVWNALGGYRSYKSSTANCADIYAKRKENARLAAAERMDTAQEKLPRSEDSGEKDGTAAPQAGRTIEVNACGLSCPGPIVQVARHMEDLEAGDTMVVRATDPGFGRDIGSWCENMGHRLLSSHSEQGVATVRIQKAAAPACSTPNPHAPLCPAEKEKTMIVFDGDLDKAIAAFIIATGAAAMGNKVHMFFTFWGLSVIRKTQTPKIKRDFMSKLFAAMLPRGSKKLRLSQMNFMGMGSRMIRSVMKKKGIHSLEELIAEAMEAGVEMTACQMSMDVMGLTKDELLDGVQVGGVATMLNNNDHSNMNLFI